MFQRQPNRLRLSLSTHVSKLTPHLTLLKDVYWVLCRARTHPCSSEGLTIALDVASVATAARRRRMPEESPGRCAGGCSDAFDSGRPR